MKIFDITLVTDRRFVQAIPRNAYVRNVLLEDQLLQTALEQLGLNVVRTNWDNKNFVWTQTKCAVIRATWDYFERINEFKKWLEKVKNQTQLINSFEIIEWNIDKNYLAEFAQKGFNIPPTEFIGKGNSHTLSSHIPDNWNEIILKPAIAGGAFETYRFANHKIDEYEHIFTRLIAKQDLLLQEFQHNILIKGEISMMCFGGKFSHAILKKAKGDDYRVQDDFGGTVHNYHANAKEIQFAENVLAKCGKQPVYARVDLLWDNNNQLSLGELELIEPELWLRENEEAAGIMAKVILQHLL